MWGDPPFRPEEALVVQKAALRSDGQRNRERIVSAASVLVARDGAEVSLEEIARQAGIGSATLHRHFRSRYALLNAVFSDGVDRLCARAQSLLASDPDHALVTWLGELTVYSASTRGMAVSLSKSLADEEPGFACCSDLLHDVAATLIPGAVAAEQLRPDVSADELMALSNGIAIAAEGDPALASRLLLLAFHGLQSR
jgi:AcrR family transcriptional regulator